jgi:hypothetical protein
VKLDSKTYTFSDIEGFYLCNTKNLCDSAFDCGQPYFKDLGPIQFIIHQDHTSPTLDVDIHLIIGQDYTDESAGIREVIIIPVNKTSRDVNGIYSIGVATPIEA